MIEGVVTVTQLNQYMKSMIEENPSLHEVTVKGEISNYKIYPSGHHYFSLKDEQSTLKCVMFSPQAARLRFRPENGMAVFATGPVTVYLRDGVYQLRVYFLQPQGIGDLQVAFEQLRVRLEAEGLFAQEHKVPLPAFPKTIAVITSGAGAAVHDIIRVTGKRWPLAKILVLPVRVQGAGAAEEIAGAIRYANRWKVADLIITGRGGGSMEDLWAFNEEPVARAIYESELPVISAVGHEPDVTIADYVADRRAATPSNAAEIAVPDRNKVLTDLEQYRSRMVQAVSSKLDNYSRRVQDLAARPAFRDPEIYLGHKAMALDALRARLASAMEKRAGEKRRAYVSLAAKLEALSPLKVLTRGYAIAEVQGEPLRSIGQVQAGDSVCVRLTDGRLDCDVKEIYSDEQRQGK